MRENAKINFSSYHHLLNLDEDGEILDEKRSGIARELARMVLPVKFLHTVVLENRST